MCAAAFAAASGAVPVFSAAGTAVACDACVAVAEFAVVVVATDTCVTAASGAGGAAAAVVVSATVAVAILVSHRNSYLKMHCCLEKPD